ncbi:hypothetical protein SCLCIDRAFT_20250 [Scleroderma citrinum Foug A]|uniref:Uncharacterized protein n=1 Tax=Scleroderma citrinum Foug A TaxID=1036808 RepID=A0A0C3EK93_9AGAM|nr:hypothetical protein SCLCIDRAFT_20250 [Scleroderma citrinum Foug A]
MSLHDTHNIIAYILTNIDVAKVQESYPCELQGTMQLKHFAANVRVPHNPPQCLQVDRIAWMRLRFHFDVAMLTAGSMYPMESFGGISEWLHGVGEYPLYRYNLDSAALMPWLVDLPATFGVVSGWLHGLASSAALTCIELTLPLLVMLSMSPLSPFRSSSPLPALWPSTIGAIASPVLSTSLNTNIWLVGLISPSTVGSGVPFSGVLGISVSVSTLGPSVSMLNASIASPKPFGSSECCHAASRGLFAFISMLGMSPCPLNASAWIPLPSVSCMGRFGSPVPSVVQLAQDIRLASCLICLTPRHI